MAIFNSYVSHYQRVPSTNVGNSCGFSSDLQPQIFIPRQLQTFHHQMRGPNTPAVAVPGQGLRSWPWDGKPGKPQITPFSMGKNDGEMMGK